MNVRTGRAARAVVAGAILVALVAPVAGVPGAGAAPGDISTLAGGGVGDNGLGPSGRLRAPQGLALDPAGNLYIADQGNNRVRKLSAAGVLTTVAGTGGSGYNGDGILATAATLNSPADVAVDGAGNLFIADLGNFRIRRVDAVTGIITTVAGSGFGDDFGDGGPALEAAMIPAAVAVDPTGRYVYYSDQNSSRVRRIDLVTGTIDAFAGQPFAYSYGGDNGPAVNASLNQAFGLAVDAAGNVYIADLGNNRIRRVDTAGVITTFAGNGSEGPPVDGVPATSSSVFLPSGVAVTPAGEVLIVEQFAYRVRKVDTAGIITTVAGNGTSGFSGDEGPATAAQLDQPSDAAGDAAGNVYISDTTNNRVRKVDPAGIIHTAAGGGVGDGGQARDAVVESPWGVAVDGFGNVYVSENAASGGAFSGDTAHRVRRITPAGTIATVAGTGAPGFSGDDGPATAAQLDGPRGVAVDAAGNVFIADCGNHRVRRVAVGTGIITTVAGNGTGTASGDGGPATAAGLSCPSGVFVVTTGANPAPGTLFIADAGAHQVRKVSPDGIITTVAGTGAAGYSGDHGLATAAQINGPADVAVDATGNLFIADERNHRVRRVNPAGIITTFAGDGRVGLGPDGVKATDSRVTGPTGVAVDGAGNLLIAEAGFARVRRVDRTTRIITTVAGKGVPGFGGDGGRAVDALLDRPTDVALDASGNLVLTDRNNDRVRLVEAGAPPPGPATGCGRVITTDTTLVADVGPCAGNGLVLGGDNVTLDLAGHRVFGDADRTGRDAGILLTGRKGVTVKGGTVEGFDAGVSVIGGSGNTIRDMVVRDNIGNPDSSVSEYGDGIVLLFSKENSVLDNLVTHNGNYDGIGVLGVGADRNLIQGNTVENTVTEGFSFGIGILVNPILSVDLPREVSLYRNRVLGNTVRDNESGGISTLSNINGVIEDNVVTGNGTDGFAFPGNGIGVQSLLFTDPNTRVLVRNNEVHGNGRSGIDVLSRSNRIVGNDASNNLTTFGGFDLLDENPDCDNNFWSGNIWGSGGFSPACTAAGGHEAPGTPVTPAAGTSAEEVRSAAAAARWEPPPRPHPPIPRSGRQPGPR
jgi:sugar lactone lactonase YvrE